MGYKKLIHITWAFAKLPLLWLAVIPLVFVVMPYNSQKALSTSSAYNDYSFNIPSDSHEKGSPYQNSTNGNLPENDTDEDSSEWDDFHLTNCEPENEWLGQLNEHNGLYSVILILPHVGKIPTPPPEHQFIS